MPPTSLLLGRLTRQTLINAQGQVFVDQPGGNLLYAAAGLRLWDKEAGSTGLIARVGADYPAQWLAQFEASGLDVEGVNILPENHDLRSFTAYSDVNTAHHDHPIPHFARLGQPFPKSLLGYKRPPQALDHRKARSPLSLREGDIPAAYRGAKAAHLCPLDYFSHLLMPPALREAGIRTITLEASPTYMHPSFWNDTAKMVSGLLAFHATEAQLRALFGGRSGDLWEMAERLASLNCAAVLIHRGGRGQFLFDAQSGARYHIPPYPAQPKDRTHEGSSYAGGFLAGWLRDGDLLRAALHGAVTASLAAEGSGPFYALDALPTLAESRLSALASAVQSL
jgi:sugar/nucleoside kinase (ribokinase family)